MKRKLFLILVVALFASVAIFAFAACDDGDSSATAKGDDFTIPKGDNIFTEDATYEEILTALENAESLTMVYEDSYCGIQTVDDVVYVDYNSGSKSIAITSSTLCISQRNYYEKFGDQNISSEFKSYYYISDNFNYEINNEQDNIESFTDVSKSLAEYDENKYEEYQSNVVSQFLDLVTKDEFGKLILNGYEGYIKLLGDRIEIVLEQEQVEDGQVTVKVTFGGVNAGSDIPPYVRALESQAEWSDSVYYNGVGYSKMTDEYGSEYYVADSIEEGAVPETTINTLPVRSE